MTRSDKRNNERWQKRNSPRKSDNDYNKGSLISSGMLELLDRMRKWALEALVN